MHALNLNPTSLIKHDNKIIKTKPMDSEKYQCMSSKTNKNTKLTIKSGDDSKSGQKVPWKSTNCGKK